MNFKLNALVAAALLAAAGSANAALDDSLSGNGSLYLSVWNGTDTSAMFDLGYNMDSFLPAAMAADGISVNWNLVGSSVTGHTATTLGYGSTWADFAATVTDWNTVVFDVAAMDSNATVAGGSRYLSTSFSPLATVQTQSSSNLLNFRLVDAYVNYSNPLGTHAANANGANLATALNGNAYYAAGGAKGDKWQNKATFDTNGVVGSDLSFYMLSNTTALGKASVVSYAGTFNLSNTGVLAYATAPVPEASTYGMMLAGLGLVGFIARRRLSA
jgi:hypothetical protein